MGLSRDGMLRMGDGDGHPWESPGWVSIVSIHAARCAACPYWTMYKVYYILETRTDWETAFSKHIHAISIMDSKMDFDKICTCTWHEWQPVAAWSWKLQYLGSGSSCPQVKASLLPGPAVRCLFSEAVIHTGIERGHVETILLVFLFQPNTKTKKWISVGRTLDM